MFKSEDFCYLPLCFLKEFLGAGHIGMATFHQQSPDAQFPLHLPPGYCAGLLQRQLLADLIFAFPLETSHLRLRDTCNILHLQAPQLSFRPDISRSWKHLVSARWSQATAADCVAPWPGGGRRCAAHTSSLPSTLSGWALRRPLLRVLDSEQSHGP